MCVNIIPHAHGFYFIILPYPKLNTFIHYTLQSLLPMKFRIFSVSVLTAMLAVSCAPGKYEKTDKGIIVNVASSEENATRKVRLQVLGDKIIRVSATPDKKFADEQSLVVVPQQGKTEYSVEETDSTVSVLTSEVKAVVALATGDVKFYNLSLIHI